MQRILVYLFIFLSMGVIYFSIDHFAKQWREKTNSPVVWLWLKWLPVLSVMMLISVFLLFAINTRIYHTVGKPNMATVKDGDRPVSADPSRATADSMSAPRPGGTISITFDAPNTSSTSTNYSGSSINYSGSSKNYSTAIHNKALITIKTIAPYSSWIELGLGSRLSTNSRETNKYNRVSGFDKLFLDKTYVSNDELNSATYQQIILSDKTLNPAFYTKVSPGRLAEALQYNPAGGSLEFFTTGDYFQKLLYEESGNTAAKFLLGQVSSAFLIDFYKGDTKIKLFENGGTGHGAAGTSANYKAYKAKTDLSRLDSSHFKEFFLFDVFREDTCLHGNKVYDVVKEVLESNGLGFALKKVEKIPINYYANNNNITKGDLIYRDYVKKMAPDDEDDSKVTTSARITRYFGQDNISPVLYLMALYKTYSDRKPDIISSSYGGISANVFHAVTFSTDNRNTVYLTAAGNEDSMTIEDYLHPLNNTGEQTGYMEPQYTYLKNRPDYGTIIVGNQTGPGLYRGRYSADGRGVTVLGKGLNWGRPEEGCCIAKSDTGTSFSTPEVATQLYIAKAYWRSKGLGELTQLESRRRLTLSSNLSCEFIGKYSSAGSVNLDKLLQTGNGYMVAASDSIITIDSILQSSTISYSASGKPETLKFTSAKGAHNISGFYSKDGRFFVFRNSGEDIWEEISGIENMLAVIAVNGQYIPVQRRDFDQTYKQVVILK